MKTGILRLATVGILVAACSSARQPLLINGMPLTKKIELIDAIQPKNKMAREIKNNLQCLTEEIRSATHLILKKGDNGNFILRYVEDCRIVFKTIASPGKPQSDGGVYTPEGKFSIGDKYEKYESIKYKVPLPFAMRIYKGIFIHAGHTTGKRESHGCIRVPPEAAKKLFLWVRSNTEVIIKDTLP